jgi:hypothetical protein
MKMTTRNELHGNLANGTLMKDNKPSYIIDGHGRGFVGAIVWKVVPGYGRCKFIVTAGGGLERVE